ncbi:non-homologous end-joining DNA ligase [Neobacillus cucumis]|uniref:non-homologous end-joining DNA ligase n=1 Tax=Neobacillus cucumis TaxID=1740721 RepID=UPI00203B3500|nr:non-homologous end-joining DNA ligase [Neobacillus cucumis]MCM3728608.1 non-homologous end-joining DNA ligase [Neobacillus cucumis]
MEPIFAMEPVNSDTIPMGDDWIAQVKWDGVRILTYADNQTVRLYNRKKNERTLHYPEITNIDHYCSSRSVILDGEVIALGKNGKPAFHEVMRRDGLRKLDRLKMIAESVPIIYMIFDVLYLDGEWINNKPFHERNEILTQIITPNDQIQLVPSVTEAEALLNAIKEQGMEGIVLKRNSSPYAIGKKRDDWLKVKNYRDIIAVIGGFTLGHDTVNSILLGLYDSEGALHYIGHTGTGKMTISEWKDLTSELKEIVADHHPFKKKPQRHAHATWVRPEKTVKIKFAEWTESGALRQPSIEGFIDVPPEECLLEKT